MCGRYALAINQHLSARFQTTYVTPAMDDGEPIGEDMGRYNIAPSQYAPVVTHDGIENMKWGLVPSWSKAPKTQFLTFNARSESVAEKPLYRGPFKHHRCLVPATGFYEWRKDDKVRTPFYFYVPDLPVFSLAGLFDEWKDVEGRPLRTFTILTTEANELMAPVHNRMPVLLARDEEADWLDPEASPDELHVMLRPFDANRMKRHEVDRAVNSSRSAGDGLIQPVNSR